MCQLRCSIRQRSLSRFRWDIVPSSLHRMESEFGVTDRIYELERVRGAPVSDEELLNDLRRVAEASRSHSVSQATYAKLGKYNCSTPERRFGSWNLALAAAGLAISNEVGISDERLYENVLVLWQHYGRQPRRRELANSPSTISESPYKRRFGSWTAALASFVEYANSSGMEPEQNHADQPMRRSGRDPSLRLRFKVLVRDHFSCRHCGASPAKTVGVQLHVDHIVPWSKGGDSVLDNLQTLCSNCNLGKGDLEEVLT